MNEIHALLRLYMLLGAAAVAALVGAAFLAGALVF
jgi:hypothetical protein